MARSTTHRPSDAEVISDAHRARYLKYYESRKPEPVIRLHAWHDYIQALVDGLPAATVLDYGCGPDAPLEAHITGAVVRSYDPGIERFSERPAGQFDLVVCSHTLEHVEENRVSAVIQDLDQFAAKALFVVISLKPSTKELPDGTPWHTCVHTASWWLQQFGRVPALFPECKASEYAALYRCSP